MPRAITDDDMRVLNCCRCGRLLLAASEREWANGLSAKARGKFPPLVSGHVDGRGHCGECYFLVRKLEAMRCDKPTNP